MAIVHLSGTKLAAQRTKAPLNRRFMYAMGLTFLLMMHLFMPNPGGSGLALSFNATTWLGISIAIAIGLYQASRNMQFRYSKLTIGLLLSCLCLSLPLLYPNASVADTMPRLIGLWAGWLLFFTLQQLALSNQHKQRLLWFILLAVVLQASFGYLQYFWLEKDNLFGFDPFGSRPYGIFQQPNVMASFLACGMVLSGYLLARQQQKYGSPVSRISLLYLTPLYSAPLLVLLASRTGWIGAGIGALCILPYLYRFSTIKRLAGWSTSLLAGIGLGLLLANSVKGGDMVSQKASLDSVRSMTYPQTLDMLIEKPFTGYGYGRFEAEYIIYTARQHQLNPSYPPGLPGLDHPHNELMFWAVEGGIVPLLGILLAALFALVKLQATRKGTRLAILGLFVPIVLHSQLEYPFYHSAPHWIIFVILLFWLDQRSTRYRSYNFSSLTRINLRLSSLLLPAATALFMLSGLHSNYILTKFERSSQIDPTILEQVSNPAMWQDRYEWNIYSSYLKLGLTNKNPALIQPYIDWSQAIIRNKPREAFYKNLILAYLGSGDESKAEQIRAEAQFLFPRTDFSQVKLKVVPADKALSPAVSASIPAAAEGKAK